MTYLVTIITGERSSGLLIVERNRELENRYSKYVDSVIRKLSFFNSWIARMRKSEL